MLLVLFFKFYFQGFKKKKKKRWCRQGCGQTSTESNVCLSLWGNRAVYNYDLFSFGVQHTELPSLHFLLLWNRHKNVATVITVIVQVFAKPFENSEVTCRLVSLFGVFLMYFLPHERERMLLCSLKSAEKLLWYSLSVPVSNPWKGKIN